MLYEGFKFQIPLERGYNLIGGIAGHHWAILLNGRVHEIGKFQKQVVEISDKMFLTRKSDSN